MKRWSSVMWIGVVSLFLFGGCASPRMSFDPKPEDKLVDKEKFALIDYVRGFVLSSKRLRLPRTIAVHVSAFFGSSLVKER